MVQWWAGRQIGSSACWHCRARSPRMQRALDSAGAHDCARSVSPADLVGLDALVMPGGESTTMSRLLTTSGLFDD